MKLAVRKHDIEVTGAERLVSGSVNLVRCEFSFDNAWEGYAKTAVFSAFGGAWAVPLVENAAVIPWEALEAGRRLRIGVYGVKGDTRLPTVYTEPLFVEQGAEEGGAPAEPTPDKWAQLLAAVNELAGGKDGISPAVSVEKIENGCRITVTDAQGSKSFDVMDASGGSFVEYVEQSLTADQQAQARANIGAVSGDEVNTAIDTALEGFEGGETPVFDLAAMGLTAVAIEGGNAAVETDTTELLAALDKGPVKFAIPITISGNAMTGYCTMHSFTDGANIHQCIGTMMNEDLTYILVNVYQTGIAVAAVPFALLAEEAGVGAAAKPTAVDLTNYESGGVIVETYADGSTITYTMEFDADGNPTKITDSDGNVTTLTW